MKLKKQMYIYLLKRKYRRYINKMSKDCLVAELLTKDPSLRNASNHVEANMKEISFFQMLKLIS